MQKNRRAYDFVLVTQLLILVTMTGCGKKISEEIPSVEKRSTYYYWATLKPLNQQVGIYQGWSSISNIDNQFWVRIKLFGAHQKVIHPQFIHELSTCPTMEDDLNGDGYLDFWEAQQKVGKILIPLDGNLTSQLYGLNLFPEMKKNLSYYYSKSCNTSLLLQDLRSKEIKGEDVFAKLSSQEDLDLSQRVVMIYGIDHAYELPFTVLSLNQYPSHFTLPVACGKINVGRHDQNEEEIEVPQIADYDNFATDIQDKYSH